MPIAIELGLTIERYLKHDLSIKVHYMMYSENELKDLAQKNPKELSRILISPNSDIQTLTFGAELLGGEITDETLVVAPFRMLLKHIHATVREGAMIGVEAFYADKKPPQDILDRLKLMSKMDPSPVLKEMAKDLLSTFESM